MTFRVAGIAEHAMEMRVHGHALRNVDGGFRQTQGASDKRVAPARVNQPAPAHLTVGQLDTPPLAFARHLFRSATLPYFTTTRGGVIEQYVVEFRALNLECLAVARHQAAREPEPLPARTVADKKLRAVLRLKPGGLDLWPRTSF